MNWSNRIITLAKVLFMIFLVVELTLAGITIIGGVQDFIKTEGDQIWFSISFYTYQLSILRFFIFQILIGVVFLGIIQIWGKRFVKKNDRQPSRAGIR